MKRVSDFKVADYFLRQVCRSQGLPFVDCDVDFKTAGEPAHPGAITTSEFLDTVYTRNANGLSKGNISLSVSESLPKTLMGIIGVYLSKLSDITGGNASLSDPEVVKYMATAAAIVRDFTYSPNCLPEACPQKPLLTSLAKFPFVWLLMRDVIAPAYGCELKDTPVLAMKSGLFDTAQYAETKDMDGFPADKTPLILLNLCVEPDKYRASFLLVAALRAHGLDPTTVVNDLIGHPDLKGKVYGFSKLAFVDEKDVTDFLLSLSAAAGTDVTSTLINKMDNQSWFKAAQFQGGTNWLMPQIMEGLLGPTHGPDYTVTKSLAPYVEELWRQVAEEKERRGKEDMNLEDLLRVQSKGMKPTSGATLQELLSDERIW